MKERKYILSFDVNEQLMVQMVQKTHEVKERARPYLQLRLVHVTKPDKWSHNTGLVHYLNPHYMFCLIIGLILHPVIIFFPPDFSKRY